MYGMASWIHPSVDSERYPEQLTVWFWPVDWHRLPYAPRLGGEHPYAPQLGPG